MLAKFGLSRAVFEQQGKVIVEIHTAGTYACEVYAFERTSQAILSRKHEAWLTVLELVKELSRLVCWVGPVVDAISHDRAHDDDRCEDAVTGEEHEAVAGLKACSYQTICEAH